MILSNQPHHNKTAITFCYRGIPVNRGMRHCVASLLEKAGYEVRQIKDGPADLAAGSVLWIWGNANWYPPLYTQLRAMPRSERPLVVLWHTEPLPPSRAASLPWPGLNCWEMAKFILRDSNATDLYKNYIALCRWSKQQLPDILVAATVGQRKFLSERGIMAEWVPLGYESSYGHDLGLRRDVDVLFLGARDVPRRNRFLRRLRQEGIPVQAVGSYDDPTCWGEQRTLLLNRTKILLNFARTPGEFPDLRMILGMANKALVISEPMYRPDPFIPGRHFISTSIDEMSEKIRYFLTHDEERDAINEQAYRFINDDVTMERSVSRILDLIAVRAHQHTRLCNGSL